MTAEEFGELCSECLKKLRELAPNPATRYKPHGSTGNLAFNAVKIEVIDTGTIRLYIDEAVAPYMKYTNEPWKHGKNPNEGWFDRAYETIAEFIANKTGGIKNDIA